MVNPFLHKTIVALGIVSLISIPIGIKYYTDKINLEVIKPQAKIIQHKPSSMTNSVKISKPRVVIREDHQKRLDAIKKVIRDRMVRYGVEKKRACLYTDIIIKESYKYGNSALIQAALLESESSYKSNPKHDISTVIGMGGVYWSVWDKKLKRRGLAYSMNDLRDPIKNIQASAFILNLYMKQSNNSIKEALARYKGYSSLGKQQANNVIRIAMEMKKNIHV